MLTISKPQLTLWDAVLPAELTTLNEELSRVDRFLDDSELVQPFKKHFHERIGRPSTPIDTFIRLMYLKHRYGLGYELLVDQVRDSIMWRRFCRIPIDGKVPDSTTLVKLVKRCGDTTIKAWSCPDLVDSEQILRREQLINLPGCLEPLLFEVLRAQITQR